MNKTRQQELTRWLKQQSIISRRWLMISRLLGVASGLLIVAQAWFLARILHRMVMENIPATALLLPLTLLVLIFVLRAWVVWLRERVGFQAGQHIRYEIRRQVLDRLQQAGPAWIQGKPAGSWATLILEQIDDMHDYYARYLPQMTLAACVPLLIVITIFPINWAAALILLGTAPLIPLSWRWSGWAPPTPTGVTSRRWPASAATSSTACAAWKPRVFFIAVRQKPIIFATPRRIFANAPWKSCVWPSSPPGFWSFSPPSPLRW